MTRALVELLERVHRPRVLVVGDLILDRYVWGEADRISPEAPTPVVQLREQDARAGGAGNVVTLLHGLDSVVTCCGMVGDDADGAYLRKRVEDACGGGARFLVDPNRPTSVKTRFGAYVQSARRGMQHILRVDSEETHPIGQERVKELCGLIQEVLPSQDAVVVSDYDKGLLTPDVLRFIISECRRASLPVVVDPCRISDYARYRGANLITPNRYEAHLATGISIHSEDEMLRASQKLQEALDLEAVFLTLDRDGLYVYEAATQTGVHVQNEPREISDITGAGDTVVAVAGLLVAAGTAYVRAAELANVAAGIEVGKIGVAQVSRAEILRKLRELDRGSSAKLKALPDLLDILDGHRRRNETIVFTNGCFDILHMGHIEYLKFARRQGDLLVVGLNSDGSVRALKGPQRPILNEEDRAGLLAGLEDVDYVTVFEETSSENLIRKVRPDVLVKGEDWRDKGVVGREFVESYEGRVILAPLVEGMSTTDIVSRILERYSEGEQRPPEPERPKKE